jgi:hypothetical protein
MKKYSVKVIDGPLPTTLWESSNVEPHLATAPEHTEVLHELIAREPIFHRPEFGTTRKDFQKMLAQDFWEVTASGRRLSREFVLNTLESRYTIPTEDVWEIEDFRCQQIAAENYLVSYTLFQGERVTRRTTIWRRTADGWKILYHQGTPAPLAQGKPCA